MNIRMFKMPFSNKKFNKNQKVWVRFMTGALACCVVGKFRGRGRYVEAWVNWRAKNKEAPEIKDIEVTDEFAKRLGF